VQNTAPTAPVIRITPEAPVEGDALTCEIVTPSFDADGDVLTYTYAWEVDGAATAFDTEEVPAGETVGGETWRCAVEAADDSAASAVGAGEVSVGAGGVVWTEIWSHPLNSMPAGAQAYNGAWLGQGAVNMYGRAAWVQTSDWNILYVPATRSGSGLEAIEVDVYFPSHVSAVIYQYSKYANYANVQDYAGVHWWSGTTDVQYDAPPSGGSPASIGTFRGALTSGRWQTIRMETDVYNNSLSVAVDGVTLVTTQSIGLSGLSRDFVSLGGGSTCCSTASNIAWSNLRVFQGRR
jgi:hypothetical protein